MAYFEDLTPYRYGPWSEENTLNVGWLAADRPFPTGDPSEELVERLAAVCARPAVLPACRLGVHVCELCARDRDAGDAPRRRARQENLAWLRELRRRARAGTLADREALREAERRAAELAGPGASVVAGGSVATGEVRVAAGKVTFAAPVMVHHYVVAHRYLPPQCFVDAVLGQPPLP